MFRGGSPASGSAAITGGTIQLNDGLVGSPSYSFTNSPTTGWWSPAGNVVGAAVSGASAWVFGAGTMQFKGTYVLSWSNTTDPLGTQDTGIARDGVGVLALKNGNAAMESRVYAGNGGFISQVKSVTESLTIAAAATTVGATSIPAGAILLGVSVRVTTVIPTAATFTITTTVGGTTLNTAAVSTAATSTDPGTAAGASYRAAATTVTITPNLTPGTATGVVRLQYYYLQVTPPTS